MPVSPEEDWDYWDKKAIDLQRNQSASINAAAAKWSALAGALLGVFATVAFAGGLTTLDTLSSPWQTITKFLTTLAVLTAATGTVLLGVAAGGLRTTRIHNPLDGMEVKRRFTSDVRSSLNYLKYGRVLSSVAAVTAIAGSIMVLWAGQANTTAPPPPYLAIFGDGAVCGQLSPGRNHRLDVAGRRLTASVRVLVPVSACPK
ncbi:MAG: hypothetical protein ACLP8S_05455 [Solirubrobacteraceae bacterium]